MKFLLNFCKRILRRRTSEISEAEEELKELLEDFKEENILSSFEENFILNFLELKNLEVRDLVIPLNKLVGLDINLDWEGVKKVISERAYSYYPVYDGSIDNLQGFLKLKEVLSGINDEHFDWKNFVIPPLLIPENISVMSAVEKLIEKNTRVAFVVDQHSELTGMFRLEDVFEELTKNEVICPHPDAEGWILLPATFKIRHLEKCFNIKLPKGDFETISGLIITHLKRIPSSGEKIWIPPLEIEVLRADSRKIDLLRVKIQKSTS